MESGQEKQFKRIMELALAKRAKVPVLIICQVVSIGIANLAAKLTVAFSQSVGQPVGRSARQSVSQSVRHSVSHSVLHSLATVYHGLSLGAIERT